MKFQILHSKIQIPELKKSLIIRESLLKDIDKAQEKMLIFHGTVGYGKTVLMCQYIRLYEYPCVWYHLDEMDNDIYTFWEYLIAGFQKIWPKFDVEIERDPAGMEEKIHRHQIQLEIIHQINQYLDNNTYVARKMVLVLDDFQQIYNKQIISFIHLLLEATSQYLNLFVATKSSLPDFTASCLLHENVKILEIEDLAFTPHEVLCVLEKVMSKSVSSAVAERVYHEVEGWPAGTMFLAQYLRQVHCEIENINWERVGNEAFIQDYLMNELYIKLPYDIQQFLVQSAVLDEISVGLCNYALNITNARSNLDYLLQEDLFILRINKGSGYYRYHSMFRAFLKKHVDHYKRLEILDRAASYYLRNQHIGRCLECYLQSENWSQLLSCVLQYGAALAQEGQTTVLQQCMTALQEQKLVPVTMEQQNQLDAMRQYLEPLQQIHEAPMMYIYFFGTFRVLLGSENHPVSWRTKKTAELFACLAERHGKPICRNDLLKLLWPDGYPNNAVAMLHNMLYSIRKELAMFEQNERIQYVNKEYSLDMEGIFCDLYEIQSLCQAVEQKDITVLKDHQQCFTQYWGNYLEGIDNDWCQQQKYYYERNFLSGCLLLGQYLMEQNQPAQAKIFFVAGLEVDSYSEPLAIGLIRCYAEEQERKECKRFYEHFCKLYQNDLGIMPGDGVKAVYEQCMCGG